MGQGRGGGEWGRGGENNAGKLIHMVAKLKHLWTSTSQTEWTQYDPAHNASISVHLQGGGGGGKPIGIPSLTSLR